MRTLLALVLLATGTITAAQQPGKSKPATKATLTGCIDEHDGHYVLTNDTNLQITAHLLPAAGSAEDNFARHMGQKVTVRGVISKNDETLPTMTVDSVTTVSETCAPASGAQR